MSQQVVKYRNPNMVIILCFVTFTIYLTYWQVSTTKELRKLTPSAPSPWSIIPFILPPTNIFFMPWYYIKYSQAIRDVTGYDDSVLLLQFWTFWPKAVMTVQRELNKVAISTASQDGNVIESVGDEG